MRPLPGWLISSRCLLALVAMPGVLLAQAVMPATNPAPVTNPNPPPVFTNAAPLGLTNAPSATPATNATTVVAPAPVLKVDPSSIYSLTVKAVDGKPLDLHQYIGHVTLVVNTASKSAATDQLKQLEKLYQDYKDKGLVVLAVPSNDFGNTEPAKPEELAAVYAEHKVSFLLLEKSRMTGSDPSPIFKLLMAGRQTPTWCYHKYLVDKSGKVIAEFATQSRPDKKELLAAIDAALK